MYPYSNFGSTSQYWDVDQNPRWVYIWTYNHSYGSKHSSYDAYTLNKACFIYNQFDHKCVYLLSDNPLSRENRFCRLTGPGIDIAIIIHLLWLCHATFHIICEHSGSTPVIYSKNEKSHENANREYHSENKIYKGNTSRIEKWSSSNLEFIMKSGNEMGWMYNELNETTMEN